MFAENSMPESLLFTLIFFPLTCLHQSMSKIVELWVLFPLFLGTRVSQGGCVVFNRSAKSELWVAVDIGIKPLVSIASPISLLCLINSNSAGIDRKVGLFCQRHISRPQTLLSQKVKTELFTCYSLFSEHKQQDLDVHPDFKSLVFHIYLS